MAKYIAVAPSTELVNLKRYLLMFDQIAIIREGTDRAFDDSLSADLEWLRNQNIVAIWRCEQPDWKVINIQEADRDNAPITKFKAIALEVTEESEPRKKHWFVIHESLAPILSQAVQKRLKDGLCRLVADRMNAEGDSRVIPIASLDTDMRIVGTTTRPGDILRVLMNEMPQPSEDTSLERILQFRADPDSKNKAVAFRYWMQKMIKQEHSAIEVLEELQYLKMQYEQHMKLHGMKIAPGVWETVVTVVGEVAENLVKVKWAKLAQAPFVLSHRKVQLLEAELGAPGREISYLVHAEKEFR